ncbi:MAG TPA: hypothetical protein VGF95_04545 [Solirubrobacteraceae bacterium]|jgi:hypothetical protein
MRPAKVAKLDDSTTEDRATGAVRSVQTADLSLPASALQALWSPSNLERLGRTYWRFLARVTLGLVRVRYTDAERFVILIASPLKLIAFKAPEYEMDAEHGLVRWRIERGLLVAKQGRGGHGHLQIQVSRQQAQDVDHVCLHIEIEVANFHPAIASGLGRWIYRVTQSKIHVFVTHRFLRSLARLDLAESKVGRLTQH